MSLSQYEDSQSEQRQNETPRKEQLRCHYKLLRIFFQNIPFPFRHQKKNFLDND